MAELTLGALDQSPIPRGRTASEALQATVELAQACERFGYKRFWVAEHHNSSSFSGPAPEVMVGQIAAKTRTIQVGSGGVMLSHYSAFKVAEQFSVLNAFYPGRIELGIGRAPGSDQLTMAALAYPKPVGDINAFPQQVHDILGFMHGTLDPEHPFGRLHPLPGPPADGVPDVWLLGSSDYSARLAAELGVAFAFADFFGDIRDRGPVVCKIYRDNFKPSQYLDTPRVNVTVQALCAETEEKALYLGASRNVNKAGWAIPSRPGLIAPDAALAVELTDEAREWMAKFRAGYIDGNPQQVKAQLLEVAGLYETDDVNMVTITYDYADRMRSYELVADAFGMLPAEAASSTEAPAG
jgi:luciferase family oxidoreductase group 1